MTEIDAKPEDVVSKLGTSANVGESKLDWFKGLEYKSSSKQTQAYRENEGIMTMRKWWGYSVLSFIAVIVVFEIVLVILYGLKILSFDDSNVVIAVVIDGLLKIVGLGYLITQKIFERLFITQG